jgi:hypothetical protein
VLLDGPVSLGQYRHVEHSLIQGSPFTLPSNRGALTGPLTVAGVVVMRLLIVGGGAMITSGAAGWFADSAREMGVAVAAILMGNGAVYHDDPSAVGISGFYPPITGWGSAWHLNKALRVAS